MDLLLLLVAAELKPPQGVVQHIRAIVGHLQDRGYANALSQLAFATVGREVYFMHDDGSWEGGLSPDQVVIHEVLNLEPLRGRITAGVQRDATLAGRVERRRGAMGSKPVLAGTRVLGFDSPGGSTIGAALVSGDFEMTRQRDVQSCQRFVSALSYRVVLAGFRRVVLGEPVRRSGGRDTGRPLQRFCVGRTATAPSGCRYRPACTLGIARGNPGRGL